MQHKNLRVRIARYTAIAAAALSAGLLISFGHYATWWLLGMASLAWMQSQQLRRDINTSGLPLLIFHIVAWALLGLAIVGLLPEPARFIGDVLILLAAAGVYIRASTRRTR
jgi:hypothetical protein